MAQFKIILREVRKGDWRAIHEYACQEKACIYQPWGPNKEEDTQIYVDSIIEAAQNNPRWRYAYAAVIESTNKVIGAGEINIRDRVNRMGELSYIINPSYWGLGYGTEVAKQLLSFGFDKLGLHRIYATCDPRNIASSKLLEKVGMKREGRMRETLLIRDGWRDSLLYSILESEYMH